MNIALLTDENIEKYSISFIIESIKKVVKGTVYLIKPGNTTKREGNLITINSSILRKRPEYSFAFFNFNKLQQLIKSLNVKVIHTFSNSTIGIAAFVVAKKLNVRSIATVTHLPFTVSNNLLSLFDELSFKYLEWFYNNFDVLWLPSKKEIKTKAITYKFPPIHLGLKPIQKTPKKRKLGIYAGKLSHTRNLKEFVENIPALENLLKYSFEFYGEGELKEMLSDIKELYKINLKLHDFIPYKELESVYKKAKVAIMPSTNETLTLMPMESPFYFTPCFINEKSPIADFFPKEFTFTTYKDLATHIKENEKNLINIAKEQITIIKEAEETFKESLISLYEE